VSDGTIQNFGAPGEVSSGDASPVESGSRCWLDLPGLIFASSDLLQFTINCCITALMHREKIHSPRQKGARI
jgi:hypothetical protein